MNPKLLLAAILAVTIARAAEAPATNATSLAVETTPSTAIPAPDPWDFGPRHAAALDLIGVTVRETLGTNWDSSKAISQFHQDVHAMLRAAKAMPAATNAVPKAAEPSKASDPLDEVEVALRRALKVVEGARVRPAGTNAVTLR